MNYYLPSYYKNISCTITSFLLVYVKLNVLNKVDIVTSLFRFVLVRPEKTEKESHESSSFCVQCTKPYPSMIFQNMCVCVCVCVCVSGKKTERLMYPICLQYDLCWYFATIVVSSDKFVKVKFVLNFHFVRQNPYKLLQ